MSAPHREPAVVERQLQPIDRSRNVVITGVEENRDEKVWRQKIVAVLNAAAGREVHILDAFRIGGRYSADRTRPVLVKLQSAWDRRVILIGARNLAKIDDFKRVFLASDEPLNVRRRAVMERLKAKAIRQQKAANISNGILSVDGIDVYSLQNGNLLKNGSDINGSPLLF